MTAPIRRDHSLRLLLALPDRVRRLMMRLGVRRTSLEAFEQLLEAPQFAALPPRTRRHWLRKQVIRHATGQDVGSNIPGFHPFLAPPEAWPKFPDLMAFDAAAPAAAMLPVVGHGGSPAATGRISAGLHIHAFFLDGLAQIVEALRMNRTQPALYITGPETHQEAAMRALAGYPAPVEFLPCTNIGRDVVPFLSILPRMRSDGHDLIGHVHSKRSPGLNREIFVQRWSQFLLSSMIGDATTGQASIDAIVADLALHPGRRSLYLPQLGEPLGWGPNRTAAAQLFPQLHSGLLPERFVFSPGTMFWATPDYLAAFETFDLPWAEVVPEPLPQDGTVLHAIERLFGALAVARGDRVAICPPSDPSFFFSISLMRRVAAENLAWRAEAI